MSRQSGEGRTPPDRSSFAEQRRPAGIIPDTETTRGPFPGREADGEDDDYSELLRAAWEQLEPQVRSQKALLATPSMKGGSVQVSTDHDSRRRCGAGPLQWTVQPQRHHRLQLRAPWTSWQRHHRKLVTT